MVLLCLLGLLAWAAPARASTLVVTSSDDSGPGTLRQAIIDANASIGTRDVISFALSDPPTISVDSSLPEITDPIEIDGTTQSGYSGGPVVRLLSSVYPEHALSVSAGNSVIRGLSISGFRNAIILKNFGNNRVEGNRISGNRSEGILIQESPNNVIGGTVQAQRNVINNRNHAGIAVLGIGSEGTQIIGNFVGTDETGTIANPNNNWGIIISDVVGVTIGATAPGAGNLISGNYGSGIIVGPTPDGLPNRIQGNKIGTDVTGRAAIPNYVYGIHVNGSTNLIVGGDEEAARNVVSGNRAEGIRGEGVVGIQIRRNTIGASAEGMPLGNGGHGITLFSIPVAIRTGSVVDNVIVANSGDGIAVGNNVKGLTIQRNWIGTDASGTTSLGNGGHGIATFVQGFGGSVMPPSGALVGGEAAGDGNVIAFNRGSGVRVSTGDGIAIRANTIYSNGRFVIDLGPEGPTENDPGDVDAGANNLQNSPTPISASTGRRGTRVVGTLSSAPRTTYKIDVFTAGTPTGQGISSYATTTVVTDAAGNGEFALDGLPPVPVGQPIMATATDPAGNTSELGRYAA